MGPLYSVELHSPWNSIEKDELSALLMRWKEREIDEKTIVSDISNQQERTYVSERCAIGRQISIME